MKKLENKKTLSTGIIYTLTYFVCIKLMEKIMDIDYKEEFKDVDIPRSLDAISLRHPILYNLVFFFAGYGFTKAITDEFNK